MENFIVRSCLLFLYICGIALAGLFGTLLWSVGSLLNSWGVDLVVLTLWLSLHLTIIGIWNLGNYFLKNYKL